MSVKINFSQDGLTATGALGDKEIALYWSNYDQIPSIEKLQSIFEKIFNDSKNVIFKTKVVKLPFKNQLQFSRMKRVSGAADMALVSLGCSSLTAPFKNNKLSVKDYSWLKNKNFRLGFGYRNSAFFVNIKKAV